MAGQVDNKKYLAIKWKIMNNKTFEITIDLNQKQNLPAFIVGFVGKQNNNNNSNNDNKGNKRKQT